MRTLALTQGNTAPAQPASPVRPRPVPAEQSRGAHVASAPPERANAPNVFVPGLLNVDALCQYLLLS